MSRRIQTGTLRHGLVRLRRGPDQLLHRDEEVFGVAEGVASQTEAQYYG